MSVVGLIVAVIVIAIVMVMAKLIVDWMELAHPFRQIVLLLVGLLCLLVLLSQFGLFGPAVRVWP